MTEIMKMPKVLKVEPMRQEVSLSQILHETYSLFTNSQLHFLFTGRGVSNHVSQAQFYAYHLHTRDNVFSTIHHSGRLFQEWLVDAWAQIENNRLRFHRMNQGKLRAELYNGLQDAVLGGAD